MVIPIIKKQCIKTDRLELRPHTYGDVDRLVVLLTDPEITKTFMVPDYETRDEYVELAKKLIAFSDVNDTVHLEYGIYLDGLLIGFLNDCGTEDASIEVGYVIHPDFKGRGYATEALRALLKELGEMGFRTVRAGYFEENPASRRVMEKSGMHPIDYTDEGEYRGKLHRCLYCEAVL